MLLQYIDRFHNNQVNDQSKFKLFLRCNISFNPMSKMTTHIDDYSITIF